VCPRSPCVSMFLFLRLIAAFLTIAMPALPARAAEPIQYVLISFDGALHLEQWERSRALAQETGAHFTYFLSCVYLLAPETRGEYAPPGMRQGRSNVGSGYSREDVAARLDHIWQARAEGHEIANHACGHFDGSGWSRRDWAHELAEFDRIVAGSYAINGIEGEPEGWQDFVRSEIRGFRAPYLSTTDAMFSALAGHGLEYDSSAVSRGPVLPEPGAPIRFALPMIPEGPSQRPIIAMDYNLFVRHSGGIERSDGDGAFEARTLAAFQNALDEELAGERRPLQIGYHFTLMNSGAYWRALERFARDACARAEVRCVSYRGYIEQIETREADG
jgi:peptidoglycan/xylan/chitin deacetylase (PgdA/CDA1 family)